MPADFLSLADLSTADILALLDLADRFKARRRSGGLPQPLAERHIALLFEGRGFRTRATFALGIHQLGGFGVDLPVDLYGREPIADIAGYLDNWIDALVVRTARHEAVVELARWAAAPVVNAMTDREHPCEVLADAQTLRERLGGFAGQKIAFVGGLTNICRSWFHLAARLPIQFVFVCPAGEEIDAETLAFAERASPGTIAVTHDVQAGVRGAAAICTDAWPRAGDDVERARRFAPYQVTPAVLALARPDVVLLPCPPVTRGEEVSADALASAAFAGYAGKENLLYTQQAILGTLLQGE
jgi:ornithine carbamoyltransferase